MRLFFLLLFCGYSLCFFGQSPRLDSLKSKLEPEKINKEQFEINHKMAKLFENKNRDSSFYYINAAKQIAVQLNDNTSLSKCFLQIGILNYKKKQDDEALLQFNKIDSIFQLNQIITDAYVMSKIYRSEISKFTFTKDGVLEARKHLNEGMGLAQTIKDADLINLFYNRIGNWHGFMSQMENPTKHLDSAKTFFNKALHYFLQEDNFVQIAQSYYSLASVAASKNNNKEAESFYLKRLSAIKKTQDSVKIADAYYSLSSIYQKFNNPDKGLLYLDSAAIVYKSYGFANDLRKKNVYRDYAYLYELKSDYKQAFSYMQKAILLKDTLFKEENSQKMLQLDKEYQTERKLQEIAILKSEKALQEQTNKSKQTMLFAGLGITTLAVFFLFILYRNRQRTNEKLKALDTAKSNFFANISHEFRTPLTLITNPIESVLDDKSISKKKREQFQIAKRNSDRLLDLVNQLLDLSKIDAGQLKLQIQHGNLTHFVSALTDSFKYIAEEKHITFTVNIEKENQTVWFDKDAVEKIMVNLLSNAIKYTSHNGTVTCEGFIKSGKFYFKIHNTGDGLTNEQLNQIFDRFYQTNEQNQGSGIGLALVKEFVTLHKGKINAECIANNMIQFSVVIPVDRASFKNTEIIEGKTDKTVPNIISSTEEQYDDKHLEDNNKPILLIAEDHVDVRLLLKDTFKESYNVVEASNGEEGIALALEKIPDVIISDVMMPVKDGISLTENLKNNELTSHIPIILLTAKAGDENEMVGIETGADDYITKPFNSKLLVKKVSNLIKIRQKLQRRYSQEIVLTPKDIAVTNVDEQFLNKVQAVLDANLVESSFNVEKFSNAVGVSRMQLHRKIKALTGLSASEFVKSQRLKLAAELLKTSTINISQVGYSVGYNDHSYFTKMFKEFYKCTPTEYAKKFGKL